jgi:hypothetical protein
MGFLQTTIVQTKTANFAATPAAAIYLIDATAGNVTATLPPAGQCPNSAYEFRRIDGSGHTVTIAGAADSAPTPAIADTVTVGTTQAASTTLAAGVALRLVGDGSAGWYDVTSTAGGGGALTPDTITVGARPSLLDGDTSTYPVVVSAAVDATNDQNTTMLVGNNDAAYGLDGMDVYSGSNSAVYASSTSGPGVTAGSTSGAGLEASSTSGTGVHGQSSTAAGVVGSSVSGDGVQGTGGRYGGYFLGTAAALYAGGGIEIHMTAEPATTPGSSVGVLYWDSADNVLKFKTDDGTVHTLW